MNRAVLDASVVLKWFLLDEEYGERALRLLNLYLAEDLELLAPSLLEFEVLNGLIIARRRGRIPEDKILSAFEGFIDLGIPLAALSGLYSRIVHFCGAYNRSAYDGSYLALAEVEGADLITADERLYRAVHKDLRWVKWLGEIASP